MQDSHISLSPSTLGNERFFKRVFESSEDCIKVLSVDGALLAMSEYGQRLLEIDDLAPFINTSWPGLWNDDARMAAIDAVEIARAGGTSRFTGAFTTVAGTQKWFDVQVSPILDESGRPEFLLSVSRDVTFSTEAHATLQSRFDEEHRIALLLQQSLLPSKLPAVAGMSFDAVYRPGTASLQVGGDWYDVFPLRDGRTAVSIGDVCGHGVQSAIVMGKVRESIRTSALSESDPVEILRAVDFELQAAFPKTMVTVWLGVIDDDKDLRYAGAGHPWPIAQSFDGAMAFLPDTRPALGISSPSLDAAPSRRFDARDLKLLLLYTDGLIEETRNILAGEKNLLEAVRTLHELGVACSAERLATMLVPREPRDDTAILSIHFHKPA